MVIKPSIKRITLSRLIQVFVLAILVLLVVIAITYRNFFQNTVENKTLAIAQVIKAGLTSHMKAGIMDKRGYFLNEITSVHDIDSIEIIRADVVSQQFGTSTIFEKKITPDLRAILKQATPYYIWNDFDANVEAIIPYVASSKGSLNCTSCHNVRDGEVLGAIDISINFKGYQALVLQYATVIAIVMGLLAVLIIMNMFHVVERYIRRPLSKIIKEGKHAYASNEAIINLECESQELEDVVQNINNFNQDVLAKERDLETKNRQLLELNHEIDLTLQEIMMAMGEMEETRSDDTRNHSKRVSILSEKIALAYGMSEADAKFIKMASPLHDIGKVGIADAVLNKPGKLTDEEFEVMKTHVDLGFNVLKHSERKILKIAADIAHSHHEKYDGTGYPQGLKGDGIPIYARIVAIVDVIDALLCKRIYKEAWPVEQVIALLREERGKHFEPKLVDIVLKNMDEYHEVILKYTE